MQEWINQNFLVVFPFLFVGMWIISGYWVALTSGWKLLAKRFRLQGTFTGQKVDDAKRPHALVFAI
jgi:membrane glycosyltransferase